MAPLIRAAVIGAGFVGPHHVDAIRRTGYAEVVALAGTDTERAAAKAAALGVARSTADAEELLTDPEIDVVHICTPNTTHVAMASMAMQAGKHVVLEKPIATDSEGAEQLVEINRTTGRHAMVAFAYRGYPMVKRARELVAQGDLGTLRLVHGAYLQDWLADPTDWNWRVDPAAGGASRAVADIGTHWFDTAEFVTGRRIEAVFADLATFMPMRHRPRRAGGEAFTKAAGETDEITITSEDAATILVRFAGGARGSCVISQVSPGHKNAFSLEIAGERQSLAWEQERPERLLVLSRDASATLIREPDPTPVPGIPPLPAGHPEGWSDALRDLFRPFYAAIADGLEASDVREMAVPSYPTLEAGARALRFVDAVLRSSAEERWTSLE
ncbi:MAG TPA: Gfo/Idh/MocA family oxidoreductase [Candidatus Eisenbacteria bacterium]|nr:Gfo/Idh/MocA family oxidoreductase [Candidatus Eisenbacteria bacterium]